MIKCFVTSYVYVLGSDFVVIDLFKCNDFGDPSYLFLVFAVVLSLQIPTGLLLRIAQLLMSSLRVHLFHLHLIKRRLVALVVRALMRLF